MVISFSFVGGKNPCFLNWRPHWGPNDAGCAQASRNGGTGGGHRFQPAAQTVLLFPLSQDKKMMDLAATEFKGAVGGLQGNAPLLRRLYFYKRYGSNLFLDSRGFSDGVRYRALERSIHT